MKIKCRTDDFYVEEVIDIKFKASGPYIIYKLEKRLWDTFDLLDYLSRKYKFKNIGRAGIKDRYSHSVQYISVKSVKPKEIEEKNFSLKFIGKSEYPITQNNLLKNKFSIVIRDLNKKEAEYIQGNIENVKKFGFPNYYDEQRMGSARAKQGFIAQKLIMQHYNGALKLYLATPSKFDDSRTRRLRKYLNQNWGNWIECLKAQDNLGQFRYPLQYLAEHPKDFKGAVKTIRRDLLEMFINAFQAYIWNETVKRILATNKIEYFITKYRFGELYFYNHLTAKQISYFKNMTIPAPSPKAEFSYTEAKQIMEQVLRQEENINTLNDLKIRLDIKSLFFKPYSRTTIIIPEDIVTEEPAPDELYPKKLKLRLSFMLPKGSYATIFYKRITML